MHEWVAIVGPTTSSIARLASTRITFVSTSAMSRDFFLSAFFELTDDFDIEVVLLDFKGQRAWATELSCDEIAFVG